MPEHELASCGISRIDAQIPMNNAPLVFIELSRRILASEIALSKEGASS